MLHPVLQANDRKDRGTVMAPAGGNIVEEELIVENILTNDAESILYGDAARRSEMLQIHALVHTHCGTKASRKVLAYPKAPF